MQKSETKKFGVRYMKDLTNKSGLIKKQYFLKNNLVQHVPNKEKVKKTSEQVKN